MFNLDMIIVDFIQKQLVNSSTQLMSLLIIFLAMYVLIPDARRSKK